MSIGLVVQRAGPVDVAAASPAAPPQCRRSLGGSAPRAAGDPLAQRAAALDGRLAAGTRPEDRDEAEPPGRP